MYYIKFFDGDTDASNIDIMSIDDFTQYLMSEFLDIEAVDAATLVLYLTTILITQQTFCLDSISKYVLYTKLII